MLEHSKNAFRGYPENALSFLKEIERNNNRPWFQENKSRYEDLIRTPSLDFIEAMGTRIEKKLSPHFLAVRKKVGGSLMRVYRDTRFSNIFLQIFRYSCSDIIDHRIATNAPALPEFPPNPSFRQQMHIRPNFGDLEASSDIR